MSDTPDLVRLLVILGATVLLVPLVMMVFAWPMMGVWGASHMTDGGTWVGGGATSMWVVMWAVLLLILLGGGGFLYRVETPSENGRSDNAVAELRLAYARGDLSDDEFDERRERLQRGP